MTSNYRVVLMERLFNIVEFSGVVLTLLLAFGFQFILKEEPCPLCLLQRLGFLMIAFGLLLNLKYDLRPSHYSIILLSCLFTSFVALRQIALNLNSPEGGFGTPIFGLHLYTWSFILAMVMMVTTTLMLGIDRQYTPATRVKKSLTHVLFLILAVLVFSNILVVI